MQRPTWRRLTGIALAIPAAITLALSGTVSAVPSTDLTLTATPPAVDDGDSVQLVASLPLIDETATVTDEIIQRFDAGSLNLRSAGDIVVPFGWGVEYSFDGGNTWTEAAPTSQSGTATSWDQVNAVRASGEVATAGTIGGRQIVSGTASLDVPASGQFTPTGTTGDGWELFFDLDGHIFTIYHHTNLTVACYERTGTPCAGWPFTGGSAFLAARQPSGWVDDARGHLWANVATAASSSFGQSTGMVCIDISNFSSPGLCGGSAEAAYHPLGPGTAPTGIYQPGATESATVGTKLYQWDPTGVLTCLDMAADGGMGAPCDGQPYSYDEITVGGQTYKGPGYADSWVATAVEVDGLVFGSAAASMPWGSMGGTSATVPAIFAVCMNPATDAPCTGWETPIELPAGALYDFTYMLPTDTGDVAGVCFQPKALTTGNDAACYDLGGTPIAQNVSFAHTVGSPVWYGSEAGNSPTTVGTRIYWSDGNGVIDGSYGVVHCWDVALPSNDGDGDACEGGWPVAETAEDTTGRSYTMVVDRLNSACLWKTDDKNAIAAIPAYDTGATACSAPPDATFGPDLIVPRLACQGAQVIDSWGRFTLLSPTADGYDNAVLNVFDSNHSRITGWQGVAHDGTDDDGNPYWDLSGLSIDDSGQGPTFNVTLFGRTSLDPITANLQAIGGTPELCISATAVVDCPTRPGSAVWGDMVYAEATVQIDDGTPTELDASVELTADAPSASTCGGQLGGAATTYSGAPVSGATVALLDRSGNPVYAYGVPITTTTGSDGRYSFGYLTPGSYLVTFAASGADQPTSATTVAGAAGSQLGTAGVVAGSLTSTLVSVAVGTDGIVDAAYGIAPSATTPATTPGTLPSTGSSDSRLAMVAVLLVMAGSALFLGSSRRRA